MIRFLLDFNKFNQIELRIFAETILDKMNGNPNYAPFQSLVDTLGTLTTKYKAALFAEDGSDKKRAVKNELNADIRAFLTTFVAKIEVAANDLPLAERETYARETGFTLKESSSNKRTPLSFLDVPLNFKVVDDERPFAALATWERVVNAKTYILQELTKEGIWQDCGATSLLNFVISGTETDVKRTFRSKAMSVGGVMSDYSKPVNVWVY
jgi:hypothetical protein